MVHQEDAGLHVEMAKLAFSKGIWSYMSKMNIALRKYIAVKHIQPSSTVNAISLFQKASDIPSYLAGVCLEDITIAHIRTVDNVCSEVFERKFASSWTANPFAFLYCLFYFLLFY